VLALFFWVEYGFRFFLSYLIHACIYFNFFTSQLINLTRKAFYCMFRTEQESRDVFVANVADTGDPIAFLALGHSGLLIQRLSLSC
jgi:hypothetical protein